MVFEVHLPDCNDVCGVQSTVWLWLAVVTQQHRRGVRCEAKPGIQNLVTLGWVFQGRNMEKQTDVETSLLR